jgi:hypothetical protein
VRISLRKQLKPRVKSQGKHRLTETPLIYLLGGEREDRQKLDHDLGKYFSDRGSEGKLGVNLETPQEVFDAFKNIDEGFVACPNIFGRLGIRTNESQKSRLELATDKRTERRIPTPAITAFVGGNNCQENGHKENCGNKRRRP